MVLARCTAKSSENLRPVPALPLIPCKASPFCDVERGRLTIDTVLGTSFRGTIPKSGQNVFCSLYASGCRNCMCPRRPQSHQPRPGRRLHRRPTVYNQLGRRPDWRLEGHEDQPHDGRESQHGLLGLYVYRDPLPAVPRLNFNRR